MNRKFIAKLMAVVYLAAGATLLAGCNTMEGAGKDIERGGEKIQNKAEDVKNNNR